MPLPVEKALGDLAQDAAARHAHREAMQRSVHDLWTYANSILKEFGTGYPNGIEACKTREVPVDSEGTTIQLRGKNYVAGQPHLADVYCWKASKSPPGGILVFRLAENAGTIHGEDIGSLKTAVDVRIVLHYIEAYLINAASSQKSMSK